jgi:hypothetical protein
MEGLTNPSEHPTNCSVPQPEESTITVRVPGALKEAVEAVVLARGMTLSGLVRRALEEFLEPPQRVSELPGLSRAFDEFLRSKELEDRRGRALLLVVDDGGHRALYPGYVDFNVINGSLVAIRVVREGGQMVDPAWVLLRKNIVAWYSGAENFFAGELVKVLIERGWQPVRYPPNR